MRKLRALLILLILPLQIVIAENNNEELIITLDCPQKASPKSNITCSVSAKSNIPLNGIKIKPILDNGLTYNKITTKNNWLAYYNELNGFVITKSHNKELNNQLALLNIKTPELTTGDNKYKVTLSNIELSNTNYKLLTHEDVSKTIEILSDDNTLSNLTVTNTTLSPNFNKNTIKYQGTTTKDNITIKATPTDSSAKVSGDIGQKKLNYGSNIFNITVASPLGTTKTYTIIIIRNLPTTNSKTNNKSNNKNSTNKYTTTNKSNDASLKSINIKGHYLSFESTKYNYELEVPNKEEEIEITAIPNNSKAKVTIDKKDKLDIGNNLITITVEAEDGTICKYTVNILRKDLSHDTSIKKIIIENYKLDIKDNVYDYDLKIKEEDKLNIKVILNDKLSKYKIIGNKNLKDGSIITITVTAEDKKTQDYTIKITKEPVSNNNIFSNTNILIIISLLLIITTIITLIRKRISK